MKLYTAFAAILIALAAVPIRGTDEYGDSGASIEEEIRKARKELGDIARDRQRNRQALALDSREYSAYKDRTQKRFNRIRTETDSLKNLITVQRRAVDSLTALMRGAQDRRRQAALSQDNLRRTLLAECDSLAKVAITFPPLVVRSFLASIAVLKNELSGKTIDNTEALNRLFQISSQMEDATMTVQVSQENSPAPEIRGTCYRLRIGVLFEACVDMKGEKAALWAGNTAAGDPQWKASGDPAVARELYRAAGIREGKMLPSFVSLPLMADSTGGAR